MSQAIKVGIFAAIVLVVLAALILKIEDIDIFAADGRRLDALFDSVAGLDDKAAVRVAGVRVGRVDGIGLEDRRARVTLLLEVPVSLAVGTRASIASVGLLGDKYVELIPGPSGGPPLPEGAVVPGDVPVSLDQALARLNAVAENIEEITGSMTGEGSGNNQIARLLSNLEAISADVRDLIAANREELTATVENFRATSATLAQELPRLADRMQQVLGQIGGVVDENRAELKASLENVRQLTEGLKPAVDDLRTISNRLASGEGTIGKLLTSPEAHDKLVSTLTSIESGVSGLSETLGAAQKIQLDLGLEGYYLPTIEESQAGVQIDIRTRSQWLYRVGIADTPFGKERKEFERTTVTKPDGTIEVTTIDTFKREDELSLSALLGARLGQRLALRTGLIESSFGVSAEYPLLEDKLLLSFEAFDFNREDDLEPHLRLAGRWRLHPNLYLVGGYDDFLTGERDSYFLGGGVRWKDDDLKYLLGSVPKF